MVGLGEKDEEVVKVMQGQSEVMQGQLGVMQGQLGVMQGQLGNSLLWWLCVHLNCLK